MKGLNKQGLTLLAMMLCILLFGQALYAQVVVERQVGDRFELWIEAEAGTITPPMEIYGHSQPSAGKFLEVDGGNNSRETPPSDGQAIYHFTVQEPGQYRVWGRVIADMHDEDAFWVKMDDASWVKWKDIDLGCKWHWDAVHDNDRGDRVMVYNLEPGTHSLVFSYCIDATRLDKICITNDLDFVPEGPGPGLVADFSFSPKTPVIGERVKFNPSASSSSEGRVIKYAWDFGGGKTSTKKKPKTTFSAADTYDVTLKAIDKTGLVAWVTKSVGVYTRQPFADFSHLPDRSKANEPVAFDASGSLDADGEILRYSWDLGDGTHKSGPAFAHAFKSAGVYTVSLGVLDDSGNESKTEKQVTVLSDTPVKVIYETDMCLDVDDVGALAMLHALTDNDEAEILAVCFNETHPDGANAIQAINSWYGRPDIPVGIYKAPLSEPDYSPYLGPVAKLSPKPRKPKDVPSALEVYKNTLSAQPDASVTIISVGFINNLNDLLLAEPELVARKVKELVIMGGINRDGFNLVRHDLSYCTENVMENWPGPVIISQEGYNIHTGPALELSPPDNPVREAYYHFFSSCFCERPSWDQMAILYGVRGLSDYFTEITEGAGVLCNGFEWSLKPGHRSYLKANYDMEYYAELIEALMILPPATKMGDE